VSRIQVVGIGNPDRGDDGVGAEVIELLREDGPEEVSYLCHSGEATSLLELLEGVDIVFFVDAVDAGALPGKIFDLAVGDDSLPDYLHSVSSHGLGLGEALELGKVLGGLPLQVRVFGIQGESFEPGKGLSREVSIAAVQVAEQIEQELLLLIGGCEDA
jgi:hydrogenase maturation protease